MEEAGITFSGNSLDYDKLMGRKDEVAKNRKGIEGLLKANEVTVFRGTAEIIEQDLVAG